MRRSAGRARRLGDGGHDDDLGGERQGAWSLDRSYAVERLLLAVVPAEAGIHRLDERCAGAKMDSRRRGNDLVEGVRG